MRHRKLGRHLGRTSSHRKAMLRNLASSLFLTEREKSDFDTTLPAVSGRVITTLAKAKEVKPLVEKVITIARRSIPHAVKAEQHETSAPRNSAEWRAWRTGGEWQKWAASRAQVVNAYRRVYSLLGDKQATRIVFEVVAPRFEDRSGGYTRILKMATPRLGDAGPRAILEFVGKNDRAAKKSERPAFSSEENS